MKNEQKFETVRDVRAYLHDNVEAGVNCPCCGQFVNLYKRKLNSGMARNLIRIYKATRGNIKSYIHVEDTLRSHKDHSGHDWALLRHWGLIEEHQVEPRHGGKTQGEWRITAHGLAFVRNDTKVSKHILIFNNKLQGFGSGTTNIIEALGSNFNYYELMGIPKTGDLFKQPQTQH